MMIALLSNLWTHVLLLLLAIILLILYKRGMFKQKHLSTEANIAKKAKELMKKEKELQKQEKILHQQIDHLTVEAEHLAGVNMHVTTKNAEVDTLKKEVQAYLAEIADIKKVLAITDELLEKLPPEEIDTFTESNDFALYQSVMKKYKLGK